MNLNHGDDRIGVRDLLSLVVFELLVRGEGEHSLWQRGRETMWYTRWVLDEEPYAGNGSTHRILTFPSQSPPLD
jgi:hypothetical protein